MNDDMVLIMRLDDKDNLKTAVQKIMDDLKISIEDKRLLLKPNFVCPRKCATTDLKLVEAVIEILSPMNDLILAEGPGYEFDANKTFEILGVYQLCKKYNIPIINTRKENEF